MTTDQAWAAMSDIEKNWMVAKALWGKADASLASLRNPDSLLASTWPGMGLVVERMVQLGWELMLVGNANAAGGYWARWVEIGSDDDPDRILAHGKATSASAPSATALAAARAMEGEK